MTRTAVAIGSRAPYKEIVELMAEWQVSALPVLAGEGRVVGVVSEADLLQKEAFRRKEPGYEPLGKASKAGAVLAEDLMSSPAVTVHADATIAEAAQIMARKRVKRLPVVNEIGLLEGVVSRGDLLKVFLRPDAELAAEIRHSVLDQMPSPARMDVVVEEGVVTLRGRLRDRAMVPLLARAVQAVEGVVDVRMDLDETPGTLA
ncbi:MULTISPECIES: CBS domain-containing protein [unclassified Streptomyces]|uniref:CBS domain-containing protein n=1 Tax=unclassified Streptomyces TaxID=2593676 RepID=UPI001F1541FB|nr:MULTISPECIES: CBS domain-containing protein [unclassified Streptomyces]MCX4768695.1 CBS domain-containing protein [Streptomyces sp. NBC_01285]